VLVASHAAEPVAELPPFQGGAAGYVGYDWGMMLERVPRPRYDDLAVPDLLLGLYDWVIAWDHPAGRAWVISTGMPERGTAREQNSTAELPSRGHLVYPLPRNTKIARERLNSSHVGISYAVFCLYKKKTT